jgi:hypothetical protein
MDSECGWEESVPFRGGGARGENPSESIESIWSDRRACRR